jgi:uncharacterized protein (PEP-CTERM system associated)
MVMALSRAGWQGLRAGTRFRCYAVKAASLSVLTMMSPSGSAQYGALPGGGAQGLGGLGTWTAPGNAGDFATRQPVLTGIGRRGWTLHPFISAEETYTDNVRLAGKGLERSDFVTQLRPGLSITGLTSRARLDATYSPQLIYREREGTKDVFHYLNAKGSVEFVPHLFFIDGFASITQQNVSLLGPQAQSNINNTGNRTSVKTYGLSPYMRREFGADAIGEFRLTHTVVDYSGENLLSSDSNRLDARLVSGPAYKLLRWNVAFNKERISFGGSGQTMDFTTVSAGARRLITPTVGVLANVGYDDNKYTTIGPTPGGPFWEAGPEWNPTPRTHLTATVGHRYFGPTKSFDFKHRTRLTTWGLTYREEITTARSQALVPTAADTSVVLDTLLQSSIPDPAARHTAVETFVTQNDIPSTLTVPLNYITFVPFLQKRLNGVFGMQGVRNTVFANVFTQTRDVVGVAQPGADPSLGLTTKQSGGSLAWVHRFAPQLSSSASASYTRSEFPVLARQDNLTILRLALTRDFTPRSSGTVSVRRLHNGSNQGGAASYTENAISVLLNLRF